MTEPDWLDDGTLETPADHEDAFRTMEEIRESLRRLRNRAEQQNAKLRAAVDLGELSEDGEPRRPESGDGEGS